jgi:hypothetical protein
LNLIQFIRNTFINKKIEKSGVIFAIEAPKISSKWITHRLLAFAESKLPQRLPRLPHLPQLLPELLVAAVVLLGSLMVLARIQPYVGV